MQLRQSYRNLRRTDLTSTIQADFPYCCFALWCTPCVLYMHRRRALYNDMPRYACCVGYMPCSGRCGEGRCPEFRFATEVLLCLDAIKRMEFFYLQLWREFQIIPQEADWNAGECGCRTKLTICEGEDGTKSSNEDVLIFPDMIRYRGLTHFDVGNFVEEVLVKDVEWLPGSIGDSYVFVCCHASRDKRCSVCGLALIKRFKKEIDGQGLADQLSVSACSHVGGHKYAGIVIVSSADSNGEVTGHGYGYVTPDDVPILLHKHIGQGEIVDHLWKGQMGLSEERQREALEKHMTNGVTEDGASAQESPKEIGTDASAGNPVSRITMPEIKNHPWFMKTIPAEPMDDDGTVSNKYKALAWLGGGLEFFTALGMVAAINGRAFPEALAWGQASFQGGKNVRNQTVLQ